MARKESRDKHPPLRLPVISAGAEYLVMGYLMRRNILTYKAPPNNEGYDLICIHPDPRHRPKSGQDAQVRVQVKSRYQTDCDRGFPIKEASFNAFDFVIVVFMNVGRFFSQHNGRDGESEPEFYTLPRHIAKRYFDSSSIWKKVKLRGREEELRPYQGTPGFEQIAERLGIPRPTRPRPKSKSRSA